MVKKRQVLVIGADAFGAALARTLREAGHEVVVVDRDEAKVEAIMHDVTHAAIVDATDEDALTRLGLDAFGTAVVAIANDFEASVLATIVVKSAGVEHVVAKAESDMAARVLRRVGADEVVRSEHDMGVRLAQQIASPNVVESFELGPEHAVVELRVSDEMVEQLADVDLEARFGVRPAALIREGELTLHPEPDVAVQPGDRLVVIGEREAIEALREHVSV